MLAQKPWIVPIPGTTKLERLEENIAAVSVELTNNDLRDIDSAASAITVEGARYPEHLERMTGRRPARGRKGDTLAEWESFYVIVGSSGAALIGLQFVVITLIADMHAHATPDTVSAFGTPTVVHLTITLLISAIMSAPWHSLLPPSVALAMCGLAGLTYGVLAIRRAVRQTDYKAVWEDWLWYAAVPCSLYTALALVALFLRTKNHFAMFGIAAIALGLLLLAIRNAWDTVTHLVVSNSQRNAAKSD